MWHFKRQKRQLNDQAKAKTRQYTPRKCVFSKNLKSFSFKILFRSLLVQPLCLQHRWRLPFCSLAKFGFKRYQLFKDLLTERECTIQEMKKEDKMELVQFFLIDGKRKKLLKINFVNYDFFFQNTGRALHWKPTNVCMNSLSRTQTVRKFRF